jgi:hypothetical protein
MDCQKGNCKHYVYRNWREQADRIKFDDLDCNINVDKFESHTRETGRCSESPSSWKSFMYAAPLWEILFSDEWLGFGG